MHNAIKHHIILTFALLFIPLFLLSCGTEFAFDDDGSVDTGSLTFQLDWPNEAGISQKPTAGVSEKVSYAPMPASVVTVIMSVAGAGMTTMSKSFAALAGYGEISGVPLGSDRIVTFSGLDSTGLQLYRGSKAGIQVNKGQTTDCGTVVMAVYIRKLPDTGQTGDYTATFGEDSDYTINPPAYTYNVDGTVTDNVTGLMWQQQDDNTTRIWADAGTYCGSLTIGSYSDWRLPTVTDLVSIVDAGTFSPAINAAIYPGTISSGYYWSSTTYADSTSSAWGVSFRYGYVTSGGKVYGSYVRCVRGGQ